MLYLLLLVAAEVNVDLIVDCGLVAVLVNGVICLTFIGILACFEFRVFLSITLRILQYTSGPA